jgi:flavin-dependent dehydrogenase
MSAARVDVVVVGAGPAGAATAILLAEHGLDVVLDRGSRHDRRSAASTGARRRPRAWTARRAQGGRRRRGGDPRMRITAPDGTAVTGHYRDVGAWRPYRQHAMGVAREILDGALIERVRALPLDLREQTRVVDLLIEDGAVRGVRFADRDARVHDLHARLVVGADGRASVVAERLGCRRPHALRRMALVTYVAGLESCRDLGEIFVDPPDYAILNPIAPDRVNLALVVPLEHGARWSDRLDDFMARACASCRTWRGVWPAPPAWRRSGRSARSPIASSHPGRTGSCWSATPAGSTTRSRARACSRRSARRSWPWPRSSGRFEVAMCRRGRWRGTSGRAEKCSAARSA